MIDSYFLLRQIGRRQNKWYPTIFELEEVCSLLESWVIDIWQTVKHVNENLVTWEVSIDWYHIKVGWKKNDSFWILRKQFIIDASRCISFDIINIGVEFAFSISSFFSLVFQIYWCWQCSVCQGGFHTLILLTKSM